MLKRLFYYFAGANLLDGVISYFGYISGYMKELNPLMNSLLFTHPITFLLLKVWISAVMLGVGYFSDKLGKVKYLGGIFKWFLYLLNGVYTFILLYHLKWILPIIFRF